MAEVTQLTIRTVEQISESPFYISMTGPAARPRRSLKHDDTFIVLDSHGDIGASAGGPDGLFNADTRYLARLEMVLDDMQPLLLGSNLRDDNSALTVDLTNSDVYRNGRLALQKDTLHIVRSIFLWRGSSYQRIGLQNHGDRPASFDLTLLFDNDFADLFEVRGERRERRGVGSSKVLGPTDVAFESKGLDDQSRITRCISTRDRRGWRSTRRIYHFELAPQQVTSLFVAVSCNTPAMEKPAPFFRGLLAHRREMRKSTKAGATNIETSNNIFNEVLCRSMADLNMLMTQTPHGRYPYAGIPWYSTTFGRDGLITALQMLWIDPRIARGVLRRLAVFQARPIDPLADAEPARSCTRCAAEKWPRCARCRSRNITAVSIRRRCSCCWRGFMSNAPATNRRSLNCGPRSRRRWAGSMAPAIPIGDGFVEYRRATEQGLANQGWKDSFDAIFHADGNLPKATSRWRRCRAMSSPPSDWRRGARGVSACTDRARDWSARPHVCRAGSRTASGAGSAHLRAGARWEERPAKCGRRMPDNCCSPALSRKNGRGWSPPI